MSYNYPYLKDSKFLKKFDELKIKEQFVKLIVLNFNEEPIEEIQGRVIDGSFNIDGSSAMRRTGNINLIIDDYEHDFITVQGLLSMNKKIEVLIGFTNMTDEYSTYDIIWFPMGIYIIINPNISHGSGGITVSLTLHDKMALLNGECGGTFPASVVLNQVEDIDENGDIAITQPTIYQIIQELVNHFGGQQLGKIIISDVDNRIKRVMKWIGSTPLYLFSYIDGSGTAYNYFDTSYNVIQRLKTQHPEGEITEFSYGEDVGYILSNFIYPGELISNAGETIVSVLDKIKNMLGNYEYFYDINGNFRFQEIKNYLNTSYSTFQIDTINNENYLVDYTSGKSVYTFEDANIILSYTNAPQYQQIKNDFIVWGKRTGLNEKDVPIRYHLAIDEKPKVGNSYRVFFFIDPDDGITKAKKPMVFNNIASFPEKGEVGIYYLAANTNIIYKWEPKNQTYISTNYQIETVVTNDFRSELYLSGVEKEPFGLSSNYYFTELKNEWPKLYDLKTRTFKPEVIKQPSNIDFFLDFIDTDSPLAEFNISNIGRRTKVISDDTINCIFEPDNPNIVIIETGSPEADEIQQQCIDQNQEYTQVRSSIYSMLANGGALKSAYEEIRKELYQYTSYNEQVTITTLPIYYLEPNTRITIRDNQSGIYGDYMIKTISIPLNINGTMSLNCTRALERI